MTKLCPRGKAAAKRKFKVYPSAYANSYASKICAGKIKDPSGKKRKDWGPKKANKGGVMKVKKMGLGAMAALGIGADDIRGKGALLPLFGLAGMAKYASMNKKKNRTKGANMGDEKARTGLSKKETEGMNMGGMASPSATGSYIKQNIDGDESFTNPSTQAYYKGMLD